MESFYIQPKEPTILSGQEYYELLPTSLWHSFCVDTVHVIPEIIDVERFNSALSRTLSLYPLAAGRLHKPSACELPWKIQLTNSGVPVTVVNSDAAQIFPTNTIVQSPLNFVRSVNLPNIVKGSTVEPLLQVTLTRFTSLGQSSIGLSSSHSIGDGSTVLRFLRLLSQNYQGLDSLDPIPSYQPFVKLDSSSDTSNIPEIPAFANLYKPESFPLPWKDISRGELPVRVNLRFTATQLREIHQGVLHESNKTDSANLQFSRQDTIIALLAHSISQADNTSPPVRYITNTVNHRGMGIAAESAACNALALPCTQPPPPTTKKSTKHVVLAITKQIRSSILEIKNIENLYSHICKAGSIAQHAAFTGMGQDFTPRPGYMTVNSTWKFNWHSAHFGYPNRTRFYHTVLPASRYVKIFTPNPTLLPDGTWKVHHGEAEVSFYLPKDVKDKFEKVLQENSREIGMSGEVEFLQ